MKFNPFFVFVRAIFLGTLLNAFFAEVWARGGAENAPQGQAPAGQAVIPEVAFEAVDPLHTVLVNIITQLRTNANRLVEDYPVFRDLNFNQKFHRELENVYHWKVHYQIQFMSVFDEAGRNYEFFKRMITFLEKEGDEEALLFQIQTINFLLGIC